MKNKHSYIKTECSRLFQERENENERKKLQMNVIKWESNKALWEKTLQHQICLPHAFSYPFFQYIRMLQLHPASLALKASDESIREHLNENILLASHSTKGVELNREFFPISCGLIKKKKIEKCKKSKIKFLLL